jgi:hypothetical protein
MAENIIDVEQIHADTVLIVVRGDFQSFCSLEKAKYVREQLEGFSLKVGKPVMYLHHELSIESLNDEQLAVLGLQRIKD